MKRGPREGDSGAKPGVRLCFLSQYFHPEPGATSEMLSGVAVALARSGRRVGAIAAQPSYMGVSKLPRKIVYEGVRILRVWSTQMSKDSAIGRILNTLTFSLSALAAALRSPPDTIHIAVTNPPLLPWVALAASVLRGRRYCLLIHDVYPDIAVKLGALGARSPVTGLWRRLNRWSYGRAERIVVLGRDMLRVIEKELLPAARPRGVVIPNWGDGRAVVPMPRGNNELLKSLGARDRFVVQYSGNIGRFHEIETVLKAAERLSGERFLFLFIGTGRQVGAVRRAVRSEGNVVLLPFQPRERLGETLTACDVGLVTLREGLAGLAVPSKLYGVLAAGRPLVVIAPDDSEAALVVKEERCGVIVPPGDVDRLVEVLRRMERDRSEVEAMGRAARRALERRYDLAVVARRWEALLAELGQEPGTAWRNRRPGPSGRET